MWKSHTENGLPIPQLVPSHSKTCRHAHGRVLTLRHTAHAAAGRHAPTMHTVVQESQTNWRNAVAKISCSKQSAHFVFRPCIQNNAIAVTRSLRLRCPLCTQTAARATSCKTPPPYPLKGPVLQLTAHTAAETQRELMMHTGAGGRAGNRNRVPKKRRV